MPTTRQVRMLPTSQKPTLGTLDALGQIGDNRDTRVGSDYDVSVAALCTARNKQNINR